MTFTVEIYRNDKTGNVHAYVANDAGGSGADYPCETVEDIGKVLSQYIETYYATNPADLVAEG